MEQCLQDQIRTGEFTFCERCGHICRIGSEGFMCISCTCSLLPRQGDPDDKEEIPLRCAVELELSGIILEYRKRLAELRLEKKKRTAGESV